MSHMLKNESHVEFAQSICKLATRASDMSDGERLSKGLHDSGERFRNENTSLLLDSVLAV